VETSRVDTAPVTYSGSSTDLPARVVSPYYSEAARFPAPEGTEEGRCFLRVVFLLCASCLVAVLWWLLAASPWIVVWLTRSSLAARKWVAKLPIWAPAYRCLLVRRPEAE
jgi:hypothetical protein